MKTIKQLKHWIGGAEVEPESGAYFDDLNPEDDSLWARAADGTPADVDRAVQAAEAAFVAGRDVAVEDRERWLFRAAEILEQRGEAFVETLVDETGSPISKARREIATAAGVLRAAAGAARRVAGQTLPTSVAGRMSLSLRRPLGVVAAILPFNVPLIKAVKHSAMPLATGNSVVLLPSPLAPAVAGQVARVYADAGVPAGAVNVVLGDGAKIGDSLTGHGRVRAVGFTGSTATGRHIAQVCARSGKRVTLEMGGKNPLVILKDADIDKAVAAAVLGAFFFQGQVCLASSRIYIEETIYEQVAERIVAAARRLSMGELRAAETMIGPIISPRQRERVQCHIADALDHGATARCGGRWRGNRCEPTVLSDINESMLVAREETIGPVATVEPVEDLQEAIAKSNELAYGLTASIFTADHDAAMQFAERCEAGMVHVNAATVQEEPHVPFGGVGDSGFGREGAIAGIDELTEWKWITLSRS